MLVVPGVVRISGAWGGYMGLGGSDRGEGAARPSRWVLEDRPGRGPDRPLPLTTGWAVPYVG